MSKYPVSLSTECELPSVEVVPLTSMKCKPRALSPGVGEVWLMTANFLEPHRNELAASLSASEKERCLRFVREEDRARATLFRGAVRFTLASCLNRDPSSLSFNTSENGKPSIQGSPLAFNISHSGDWLAIALGLNTAIGVDIEERGRDLKPLELAEHSFHKNEATILAAHPEAERLPLFMKWWTAKEAALKAWGDTLFSGVGALDFSAWLTEPARALQRADSSRWHAWRFECENLWGTVVAGVTIQRVTLRQTE